MKVIVDADYIHNLPEAVGKSNVNKDSLTVTPHNNSLPIKNLH